MYSRYWVSKFYTVSCSAVWLSQYCLTTGDTTGINSWLQTPGASANKTLPINKYDCEYTWTCIVYEKHPTVVLNINKQMCIMECMHRLRLQNGTYVQQSCQQWSTSSHSTFSPVKKSVPTTTAVDTAHLASAHHNYCAVYPCYLNALVQYLIVPNVPSNYDDIPSTHVHTDRYWSWFCIL